MISASSRRTLISSLEPLEARIAPAGLVSAVLSPAGQLSLSTVASDVDVQLEQLTGGAWVLTGQNGCTVQFPGGAAQTEVFFKGLKGDLDVLFSAGLNALTLLDSALPVSVVINAGVGGVTNLFVNNSSVAGSVSVFGGSGFEQIAFSGFKASVGHDVVLSGNAGGTSVQSFASFLTIGGKLSQTGDVDTNTLSLPVGTVKIGGNLELNSGATGKTVIHATPAQLTIGGGVTIVEHDTGGDINLSPTGVLRVAKLVSVTSSDGEFDVVHIGDGSVAAILGGVMIDEQYKPHEIKIAPVSLLQVAGSLVVKVGAVTTTSDTQIHADVIKIGGHLMLDLGGSNGGSVAASIDANSSLSVKGDLTLATKDDKLSASIVSRGLLTVGGKLAITSTDVNATTTDFDIEAVTGKIGKDLEGTVAGGAFTGSLGGGNFSIGGALHLEEQAATSKLMTIALTSLTVKKGINAVFPSGSLYVLLQTTGALNVGADLNLINDVGGPAGTTASIYVTAGTGKIGGNLFVTHHGTSAEVQLTASKAPLAIGGQLITNFTETTTVTAIIRGLNVGGDFTASTGASNDTFSIDDINVKGLTTILPGGGGDHVNIETLTTHARRTSTFGKAVDIELGFGNDSILIGVNGDATRRATFLAAATFDGGFAETDTITFANAIFKAGDTATNFEFGP